VSEAERAYLDLTRRWDEVEGGYKAIQSTKPQIVGYGLNDLPGGLAAWVLDKWRSWFDSGGDLDGRFSRDFLLTILTIFWVTDDRTLDPGLLRQQAGRSLYARFRGLRRRADRDSSILQPVRRQRHASPQVG
jgi:hypothetical protein